MEASAHGHQVVVDQGEGIEVVVVDVVVVDIAVVIAVSVVAEAIGWHFPLCYFHLAHLVGVVVVVGTDYVA